MKCLVFSDQQSKQNHINFNNITQGEADNHHFFPRRMKDNDEKDNQRWPTLLVIDIFGPSTNRFGSTIIRFIEILCS